MSRQLEGEYEMFRTGKELINDGKEVRNDDTKELRNDDDNYIEH
jgi:hypothetical protein